MSNTAPLRIGCLALHLAASLFVSAATYALTTHPESSSVRVVITLESASATAFRMPAWAPGDYRIVNFGNNLSDVEFSLRGEKAAASRGADPNLWTVPDGADSVSYTVSGVTSGIFSENLRVTRSELFISGPAVFGYFEGYDRTPHLLRIDISPKEANVLCSLRRIESGDPSIALFSAPDYDVLIDSPIVMGDRIQVKEFVAGGKNHAVVAFGRTGGADLNSFVEVGSSVAEQCRRLFGALPFDRYLFLYDFGGPGGGLEHANSARMAMPRGASASGSVRFIAHEYLHAFNVKRIRPKPLGPFDYTKPAITGALWWLEGVTDYYAEIITYRAGLQSRDQFLNALSRESRQLRRDSSRLRVTADEASRRVWEAGNSRGFGGLDYYRKGKLIGLCLDLAIHAESEGRRSLDDVLLALYAETKNGKPGFAEGRIRELCILFGGKALGPIYDRCVLKAENLPVEELLLPLGMVLRSGRIAVDTSAQPSARQLGSQWPLRVPNAPPTAVELLAG